MFCPIRCMVNIEKNNATRRKNSAIMRSAKKKKMFPGKTPPPPWLDNGGSSPGCGFIVVVTKVEIQPRRLHQSLPPNPPLGPLPFLFDLLNLGLKI